MKTLNWNRVPCQKVLGRQNLWSSIASTHKDPSSENVLDFDMMEDLFCQQPPAGSTSPKIGDRGKGDPSGEKKKRESLEINLLDGKRSLNINIFLKQFRNSNQEIINFIRNGSHEDIGAERLRGLLKILPEKDEMELLKGFQGDFTKLGNAEKFLMELIQLNNYKLRIEGMLLKEDFATNMAYLEPSLDTIRNAAQELQTCQKLHEVLFMVLVAGNFLNAGSYAGNAAGFKMLSLTKLGDIRANKPGMNLLHYVALEAERKHSHLLNFPEELAELEEASKLSIEGLRSDTSSLRDRVRQIAQQVHTSTETDLKDQMEQFLKDAETQLQRVARDLESLEKTRIELADFLCEDVETFKMEECFRVFLNFTLRFKMAIEENRRREEQEKKAELRRRQREEHLKRRISSGSIESHSSSNGGEPSLVGDHIMDYLIGDIRSGFPDHRNYQDGRRKLHNDDHTTCSPNLSERNANVASDSPNIVRRRSKQDSIQEASLDYTNNESLTYKRQRSRPNSDEQEDDDLLNYLKKTAEEQCQDPRDRSSWGSSAEGSLDRNALKRLSGRRRRSEMELNESRERPASPSLESVVVLDDKTPPKSKQWKQKIEEWMQENEKEELLQAKILADRKKREYQKKLRENKNISFGDHTSVLNCFDSSSSVEHNERHPDGNGCNLDQCRSLDEKEGTMPYDQDPKVTNKVHPTSNNCTTSKPSSEGSVSSENELIPFSRNSRRHSTRDTATTKIELSPIVKDDIALVYRNRRLRRLGINTPIDLSEIKSSRDEGDSCQSESSCSNTLTEKDKIRVASSNFSTQSATYDDKNSSEVTIFLEDIEKGSFDRFAASRKTTRKPRLSSSLSEEKSENEVEKKKEEEYTLKSENGSQISEWPEKKQLSPKVDLQSLNQKIMKCGSNGRQDGEELPNVTDDSMCQNTTDSQYNQNSGKIENASLPQKESKPRSKIGTKSRLARRLQALETPLLTKEEAKFNPSSANNLDATFSGESNVKKCENAAETTKPNGHLETTSEIKSINSLENPNESDFNEVNIKGDTKEGRCQNSAHTPSNGTKKEITFSKAGLSPATKRADKNVHMNGKKSASAKKETRIAKVCIKQIPSNIKDRKLPPQDGDGSSKEKRTRRLPVSGNRLARVNITLTQTKIINSKVVLSDSSVQQCNDINKVPSSLRISKTGLKGESGRLCRIPSKSPLPEGRRSTSNLTSIAGAGRKHIRTFSRPHKPNPPQRETTKKNSGSAAVPNGQVLITRLRSKGSASASKIPSPPSRTLKSRFSLCEKDSKNA